MGRFFGGAWMVGLSALLACANAGLPAPAEAATPLPLSSDPAMSVNSGKVGQPTNSSTIAGLSLTPIAAEVCSEIGAQPMLQHLVQLKSEHPDNIDAKLDYLKTKDTFLQAVVLGMLQVRDVTARIDREIAQSSRVRQLIQDKTNRGLKYNTLANVFGGGALNEIGQVGELFKNELPGEIVEIVASATTTGLSGYAMRQQNGGTRRVVAKPGLLAKILDFSPDTESDYPPVVWAYLNARPGQAATGPTRLDMLRTYWASNGFAPDLRTPQGKRRAALLAGVGKEVRLSVDVLDDRAALLQDLRAEVLQVDRGLLELLTCTQAL